MLEPHVPEDLTSYIVEAYVALRAQSGQDAKNGDQVWRSLGVAHVAACFQISWGTGSFRHTLLRLMAHTLVVSICPQPASHPC